MTKFEERLAAVLLEQDEKEKAKARKLEKMQQEAVQAKREAEELIHKSKIVRDATDEEAMVAFLTESLVATYYIHDSPKWKKGLLELVIAAQQDVYATKIKRASKDVNDIKKELKSSIKEGLIEESLGSSLFKAGSVIAAFLCMIGVIKCPGGRSKDKSGKSLDPIMQRCNCAMVDILCSQ